MEKIAVVLIKDSGLKGWRFEYGNAKALAGCAGILNGKKIIRLSKFYALHQPNITALRNTILHEIAHALDIEKRGYTNHDKTWKKIAKSIGCDGKAKKAEPFGYLLKPFEERELQTTIEIALYKFKMEMKLKERERWLSTILKSVGDAVIAANEKGHITFMNPLAESLTGWKNPENTSKPLSEIFRAVKTNTEKEIIIPIDKILQGERYRFPREAILLSKKGDMIPIFQSATPIKNEDKSITGVVLSFSDITRLKKAEEELKMSLTRLKNVMEGTVEAMAYTIETRDPYTAGHQRRVAKLASAIAKILDLPGKQVEGIHMAGTLHDIGKIHVPAEILNKPGKISEAEYNIIKTHSQVGFDILKSIDFPWPIAEIVLQHHERLDGSGYPQGIKKNEILLEAKILAVADTVEALATHRPYRPAFAKETALDEIKTYRDILYDKKVVDACLKIFDSGFSFDF